MLPGLLALALVFLLRGIAFLSNMKLLESGFFGNLVVATCLGMIFILAGILAGTLDGGVLAFAARVFMASGRTICIRGRIDKPGLLQNG